MGQILAFIRTWLDSVALSIMAVLDRLFAPALLRLIEEEDGQFSVRRVARGASVEAQEARVKFVAGRLEGLSQEVEQLLQRCRAELVLKAERFLFRPLELPARASEFLDGIVRSQIDRLTPWQPAEAAFGWTPPVDAGNGKILVTIAATARPLVVPYIQALTAAGAGTMSVSTINPDGGSANSSIQVLENRGDQAAYLPRIRRLVAGVLGAAAAAGLLLFLCDAVVGFYSTSQQEDLSRQITQRRVAIRAASQNTAQTVTGYQALERRKQETLPSVMVLEALSKLLPDHTYLVEIQLEGDKVRLTGVTREAPSLIRLIENSPHFSRASFFAPTTSLPNESGERFHIETRARPTYALP
jgi:general secretion pathway protein L